MENKLKAISRGRSGKLLLEVLEETKDAVANIRTPLKVRKEIENEVRLGIIEAIDVFLVEKIKVLRGANEAQDVNEFI